MKNACSALLALQFILTLHSRVHSAKLCLLWRVFLRENLIHQPLFNDSHLMLSCYCSSSSDLLLLFFDAPVSEQGEPPLWKCFLIFIINFAITLAYVVGCLGLIGMMVGGAGDDLAVTFQSHARIQEKLMLCLHYRQPCMHGPILDTDPSLFSFLILFKYNFNSHQLNIGKMRVHIRTIHAYPHIVALHSMLLSACKDHFRATAG